MSAYGITPTDLDVRLSPQRRIELTDSETAPTGVENVTVTQATIDNAEALFHGYAGAYYAVPIAPSSDATPAQAAALPLLVKRTIVAIAAYDLMARKPEWLDRGEQSLYWSRLNKDTMAYLQGLADPKRLVRLPGAGEVVIAVPTSGGAKVTSDTPLFTRETMVGF